MKKNPQLWLDHMLEAIANIRADVHGYDFEKFRNDRRARQLVERNLEILSEASRRIPEEMKADEMQIPWSGIAGIGNIIRHEYHQTHPTILWDTCQQDLEPLKAALMRIKGRL